jgi:hypothetical protein
MGEASFQMAFPEKARIPDDVLGGAMAGWAFAPASASRAILLLLAELKASSASSKKLARSDLWFVFAFAVSF